MKNVIGVVSGKGGVGKSLVTSLLAAIMQRRGYKTAILDADVTGPSIPKTVGITEKAEGSDMGIVPVFSKTGIEIMSVNLLLEDETEPVVWRGPVIAGTVKQFWQDVIWNDVDYMFVDMPPGYRRCSAYRVPVAAGCGNNRCDLAAGACGNDSRKGR